MGHIARQNPQHAELDGQEVLYHSQKRAPMTTYRLPGMRSEVPTWNSQAVHTYGRGRYSMITDALRSVVAALTEKYEAAYERPWQPDYKAAMLSAIVGVEVTISEIQGKFKLSQNRPGKINGRWSRN
ncbi:MAG: FMN-binding negative transcriptional regulator [Haliea sp.]|nr:FMN-binding negative transcriptional regulator [Haliea sp.]